MRNSFICYCSETSLSHVSLVIIIEQRQRLNMLTSHVICLEETGHHVKAYGTLLLNACGNGQIDQRRHKSRNMHCSMFHHYLTFDISNYTRIL